MREFEQSSSPTRMTEGTPATSGEHGAPLPPWRRSPGKVRSLLATAAAVLIVGLLAAVFASLVPGREQHGATATATATVASTATVQETPVRMLAAQPAVTQQPGTPVVAPSDPNVIYEYADNGTGVVLRRSDDGGLTWHDLSYPGGGAFVAAIEVAVSPLDALNVVLRLDLGNQPGGQSPCQTIAEAGHGGILASSGTNCRVELSSRDGGAHWTRIQLPVAGELFQTGVTFSYDPTTIQAWGDRLYGRVWQLDGSGVQTGDIRIVSSRDAGQSWQIADADLVRQAGHICAFSAAPRGATVFAIGSTTKCWANPAGARSVWRSDDAGAHWVRAGDLPSALALPDAQIVAASEGGTAILYGVPGTEATLGKAEMLASSDGGQTWHAAPGNGLPGGALSVGVAGSTLADGSIMVVVNAPSGSTQPVGTSPVPTATPTGASGDSGYSGGSGPQTAVICYVWKVGDASWRAVTPVAALDGAAISNVFVSNGSRLVVTLSVTNDNMSTNPTYTLQRFQ